MDLQVCSMEDLLLQYVKQLTRSYPFVRLNTDDSSTTISLGCEMCDDLENCLSHQEFLPLGKYLVSVDLEKVRETIRYNVDTTLKESEIQGEFWLETKQKVEICPVPGLEIVSPLLFNLVALNEYLAIHQRVILKIPKLRYYHDHSISRCASDDPIHIGKYNATTVSVILGINSEYHGSMAVGKEFVASIYQIECLDREKFDVFILYEGIESITYEIINKTL